MAENLPRFRGGSRHALLMVPTLHDPRKEDKVPRGRSHWPSVRLALGTDFRQNQVFWPHRSKNMLNAALDVSKSKIKAFCIKWNVQELSVFGSAVRQDFHPESDIDILVSFFPDFHIGLWEFADMRDELEALFKRRVDLLAKEALRNPFRRESILTNREILYAA